MSFEIVEWAYNEYGKESWRNETKLLLLLKAKAFNLSKGELCTNKF